VRKPVDGQPVTSNFAHPSKACLTRCCTSPRARQQINFARLHEKCLSILYAETAKTLQKFAAYRLLVGKKTVWKAKYQRYKTMMLWGLAIGIVEEIQVIGELKLPWCIGY
jgi:hypothetical protein